MGMYDNVDYKMDCPTCGTALHFQTKEGMCVLDKLSWKRVGNFYALCNKCKNWFEFTRKPAESIAEYNMVVKTGNETNVMRLEV